MNSKVLTSCIAMGMVALAACSSDDVVKGGGAEAAPQPLPTEALQMAVLKDEPCPFEPTVLERHVFPTAEKVGSNVRTRDSNCYYTIMGGVDENKVARVATVHVLVNGYPADEYEQYTKMMEETPLEGFDIPTNRSTLHKPGEEYAYSAFPAQGSFTLVVKADEASVADADALARELTNNLASRLQ